jgi:hypothetical protein
MPRLSCWFIRASLAYLIAGFTLGALMLTLKALAQYGLMRFLLGPDAAALHHKRQPDGDTGSLANAIALECDGAAVRLDNAAHEAQSEAQATMCVRKRRIHLHVRVENPGNLLGRNADTVVLHKEECVVGL